MTCCFEDLFFENSNAQIVYKGKVLLLEDELHVKNYFRVKIGILSTNSDWRQGDRRRESGSDTVYDQYQDRGCEGHGGADQPACRGRLRYYPVRRAGFRGGQGDPGDKKRDQDPAGGGHSL